MVFLSSVCANSPVQTHIHPSGQTNSGCTIYFRFGTKMYFNFSYRMYIGIGGVRIIYTQHNIIRM